MNRILFATKHKWTTFSLRKQPTFGDATTCFPAKWRLRNEHKNSVLMTRHSPDLGSAYDWLNQISHSARPIRSTTMQDLAYPDLAEWRVISTEFLRSFLRRHLAGKPVLASPNASRFSFFFLPSLDTTRTRLILPIKHRANKRNGWVRVCLHVRLCRLKRPFAIFVLSFCEHSVFQILSKRKAAHSY